jgi:Carboxylesterase family
MTGSRQTTISKSAILILAWISCITSLVISFDEVRSLDYGTFKGRVDRKTITFYNIPFAAPPIGPLRFKPPMPPLNFTGNGVIDSSKAGMEDLKRSRMHGRLKIVDQCVCTCFRRLSRSKCSDSKAHSSSKKPSCVRVCLRRQVHGRLQFTAIW